MLDTGPLAVPAVFAPHNPVMAAEGSKRVLSETTLFLNQESISFAAPVVIAAASKGSGCTCTGRWIRQVIPWSSCSVRSEIPKQRNGSWLGRLMPATPPLLG